MAIRRLSKEDLKYGYVYTLSMKEFPPGEFFPGQERVRSAFDLALKTEKEGYNLYVSGPEKRGKNRLCSEQA